MSEHPDVECRWEAWYNRQPGAGDPNLHVVGNCKLRSGSIEVRLEPGNEGIVDEPDLFVLQCTVTTPGAGGTDDYVERDVIWEGDVGPDIKRVRIQGDLEASITVQIVE